MKDLRRAVTWPGAEGAATSPTLCREPQVSQAPKRGAQQPPWGVDRPSTASGKLGESVCVQLGTLFLPFPSCHWLACRGHPEWVGQDGEGPSRDAPLLSLVLAGSTGPSVEQMPRTCSGYAKRPATWCATARPARMISPCPSRESGWADYLR